MSLGDCLRSSIVEYTRECLALEAELFSSQRALTVNHFSFFLPRFPFGLSLSDGATCGCASGY
jgi:hypothetical protein